MQKETTILPLPNAVHSFVIRWTRADGMEQVVRTKRATFDEARTAAITEASKLGWTPPRWFEFWRWRDTKARIEP